MISREAKVIDLRYSVCPLPIVSDGYLMCASQHLHRLLALTFIPIPEGLKGLDNLHVNHIDGVRIHSVLGNLEWTTPSGNSIHAYQTGLRSDNRPVLVKDLRDGTVARYYSLQECARKQGLSGSHIHVYLRPENRGKVYRRFFVYIYEGEEWPEINPDLIGRSMSGSAVGIFAQHLKTGQQLVFDSFATAGRHLGCNDVTVRNVVRKWAVQEYKGWHLREIDDLTVIDPMLIVKRKPQKNRGKRKPHPIVVTDMKTGNASEWDSVEAFGRDFNVSKNTIQKSMLLKDGMWKHYRIEYLKRNTS